MSISDITLEPVSAARKMFSCSASGASSSNAQLRKIKKPLIERRRRERINECLGQLKALVLEATKKDESRYSKMEKADILEMTVAHLKFVHSARRSVYGDAGRGVCRVADVPPAVTSSLSEEASGGAAAALRYLMGYNECVREVASYLAGDDGGMGRLGDDVRIALMRHLDDCLRLRAAEPLRLPSPNVADSGRPFDASAGASSPPPAVDSAGSTPWRQRCDSGVYSGASSPAQADELAAAAAGASPPSPLELTTRTKEPLAATSTTICRRASQLQQQTPDVDASSEVWRPW